jgi:hypothetical protein
VLSRTHCPPYSLPLSTCPLGRVEHRCLKPSEPPPLVLSYTTMTRCSGFVLALLFNAMVKSQYVAPLHSQDLGRDIRDRDVSQLSYLGCFNSSAGMTLVTTNNYNKNAWCQQQCSISFSVAGSATTVATSDSFQCWCSLAKPALANQVANANCNTSCAGNHDAMCTSLDYQKVQG